MKINIDVFLKPENLGEATKNNPVTANILAISKRDAEDLPFDSKSARYEILLEIHGIEYSWLANKTSLRSMASVFSTESEKWVGKHMKLWCVEQNVQGKLKKVIYADPITE